MLDGYVRRASRPGNGRTPGTPGGSAVTAMREPQPHRLAPLVDLATRIVRLLAWLAMFAACCVMLWILSGTAARADDPKDAARHIGQAGAARAGAIARDGANAQAVPGFAGTNVPERHLTDAGMENAARRRLADPDDPGGSAGRAVIDGAAVRPAVPVPANDPAVARGRAVQSAPLTPGHGASGLASGGSADCAAGVTDAGRGGACGRASYCVSAGCETVESRGNTGFARSAAMLNMVVEMGGEEFDRNDLRFFSGEERTCEIKYAGLANCCRDSGLLVGLANCSAEEKELAEERHAGNTHYLGRRCAKRVFGVCVTRERAWCLFGSKLGRILHQQARPQLGIGWSHC
ncbi:MAG: conjugal transfer protein TraN, partial [Spirochaetaceae bacterium]|nr:conjugal transfer protein TraN [Spirochaetaceae bacterium]